MIGRLRALSRGDQLLVGLLLAHVLIKLAVYPQVMHAELIGDETSYVNGGRALSNALRDLVGFRALDTAELSRNVVSSGWFMPGMMFLCAPLFVVDPDASLQMIRGYLGVVSLLLSVGAVLAVRRTFGVRYAVGLAIFPGLVPMWSSFSYAAWGDLTAGIMVLWFLCLLVPVLRRVRQGVPPTWSEGARLGLLAILVVYFRSSASVLSVGLCLVVGLAILFLLRGRARLQGFAAMVLAGGVFLAVLAPWSITASKALDDRVITTTTVGTVRANTFGDRSQLCFGPCDPTSTIWFTPVRYAREVSRATGVGEVEMLNQMSEYARRDVTAHSYARDVFTNTKAYLFKPGGFAIHLQPPNAGKDAAYWAIAGTTTVMFYAVLLLVLAMMLTVFRASFENRWSAIVIKLGIGALLLQPFVHIAGARYWTTAAPMFGLGCVLLVGEWRSRRRGQVEELVDLPDYSGPGAVTTARWLDRVQWLLVAGFVAVPVVLAILAV
ncbi:hypothetical protein [Nocardioides daejeonensis]|uniref:hypothetical protein n=1 Tax=Nocardioides daejeonensis TaxID=1046556 RepID=UPI000D74627D|nr:hypothetical protein [Nocardioides daejeonensis]